MKTSELFDLTHTLAKDLLQHTTYPWEALPQLSEYIRNLGSRLPAEEYEERAPQVWVARDATVAPTAFLGAPCIVGHRAEVRHCAYVRGSVLIGEDCVVGNSTELKNVILMDGVQVPHYNYVGDSILGYKAHMGAGAITSNVKGDRSNVVIKHMGPALNTGMHKLGAMVGDGAEIGCNSVLCPGSVIGKGASVYPLCLVRGAIPAGHILKANGTIIRRRK